MTEQKEPDYTLNIFHDAEPESNAPAIALVVETTKIFVSFRYDIILDLSLEERTIRLSIKGLHAPELLMPGSGPAVGAAYLQGLVGHYTVTVVKQDKTENVFDIDVGPKEVTILRSPQHPFIQVSTDPIARS